MPMPDGHDGGAHGPSRRRRCDGGEVDGRAWKARRARGKVVARGRRRQTRSRAAVRMRAGLPAATRMFLRNWSTPRASV